MLNRLGKWAVVAMLVLATGGHWALLQSIAWVRMTVELSQTEPLGSALQKTFDGQHPCELCKFVREGVEKPHHKQKFESKLDFFCEVSDCGPEASFPYNLPAFEAFHVTEHLTSPAIPPPRRS